VPAWTGRAAQTTAASSPGAPLRRHAEPPQPLSVIVEALARSKLSTEIEKQKTCICRRFWYALVIVLDDQKGRERAKEMDEISMGDRLAHGNLTVAEVVALRGTSTAQFYADLKRGRVEIRKLGRKTVVPGPIAKAYIEGRAVG
jgi:hypothetical protein